MWSDALTRGAMLHHDGRMAHDDDLMTVAQAAEHVGVHERTMRKWIADGEVPAMRFRGRFLRVRRGDADKMIIPGSAADLKRSA